MKKIDLGAVAISAIVCLISLLASNNYIIAIALLVLFIAYYFLMLRKRIKKFLESKECIYTCCHFISRFLTTLSAKESLDEAFESGTRKIPEEFANYLVQLQDMNTNEKIDYLKHYFRFNLYKMFLKVLSLYSDQGGNVLKISENLIAENSRTEELMNDTILTSRKRAAEFTILWVLAFVVILFMRFALMDFYLQMLQSPIFKILLVVFFLLFLLSIHLYSSRVITMPIKEENEED